MGDALSTYFEPGRIWSLTPPTALEGLPHDPGEDMAVWAVLPGY